MTGSVPKSVTGMSRPRARGTFTSYAGRGKAPVPAAKLHGLNPRNSDDVREWQKGHEAKGK